MDATLLFRRVPPNSKGVTVLAVAVVNGRDFVLAGLTEIDVPGFRSRWRAVNAVGARLLLDEIAPDAFTGDVELAVPVGLKGGGHVDRLDLVYRGPTAPSPTGWHLLEPTLLERDEYVTPRAPRLIGPGDILRVDRRWMDGRTESVALRVVAPAPGERLPTLEVAIESPFVLDDPPTPTTFH